MSDGDAKLVDVHILGVPIKLFQEAGEHFDELSREFLHLANADEEVRRDVPGRLLALSDDLRERFSGFSTGPEAELADAVERGVELLDVHYRLPVEAAAAAEQLDQLIDEADAYCERGDYLLTLKTPPGPLRYRKWFLSEFVNQIRDGAKPVPYSEWDAAHNA